MSDEMVFERKYRCNEDHDDSSYRCSLEKGHPGPHRGYDSHDLLANHYYEWREMYDEGTEVNCG